MPLHGGYSTLLYRGIGFGCPGSSCATYDKKHEIMSAYRSAVRVQESLQELGGDEFRYILCSATISTDSQNNIN